MRRRRRLSTCLATALLLTLVGSSGCMSLWEASRPEGPAAMGGMRQWFQVLASGHGEMPFTAVVAFAFLVLAPLDLVADVLLLPASSLNEIANGGIDVKAP